MTGAHDNKYRGRAWVLRLAFAVVTIAVLMQARVARAADIEPVLTRTDAVAGLPLVMPVRVTGAGQPRARVTLRFPDGREVEGVVAAVRLTAPPDAAGSWVAPGPAWEVLRPASGVRAADASGLVWFVLADLPPGVVGQEIWLDGKPVALRWLPRPALLGMRLGFDPEDTDAGVLAHPWSSPVPDGWRDRADLTSELAPALNDPLRAWRAELSTTGLFPKAEDRSVGLPPELLDPGIVDRVGREAPIETRLTDAVRAQSVARWRVALARLWAADPALSLRVRQALAGAASVSPGADGRVVAPAWAADDLAAGALLEMLLDEALPAAERAVRAESWLAGLPDAALWVIDDGSRSAADGVVPTIGALVLAAGDASAFLLNTGDLVQRPEVIATRFAEAMRPPWAAANGRRLAYRLLGESRAVRLEDWRARLRPPGLATGPFGADWTMGRLIGGGRDRAVAVGAAAPSALITAEGLGEPGRVRLVIRLPSAFVDRGEAWELRVWVGPFGRSRGVLIVRGDGTQSVQSFAGRGPELPPPEVTRGVEDGALVIDLLLSPEAGDAARLVTLGIEAVDGSGARHAWPRAMLPWQIEPGRRVIDPGAWLGELAE